MLNKLQCRFGAVSSTVWMSPDESGLVHAVLLLPWLLAAAAVVAGTGTGCNLCGRRDWLILIGWCSLLRFLFIKDAGGCCISM